jgi:UDP-N-acetylglucosamine 1-carboxyvinyltransferase
MNQFKVQGGNTLHGSFDPQGSKNEAFQVMCAALLTNEPVTIHNIPDILDVHELFGLFEIIGVKTHKIGSHSYTLQAVNINLDTVNISDLKENAKKIRASILMLGPLLARLKKAIIALPGGDKIGRRRLDTHFMGIKALGAQVEYEEKLGIYIISAKQLKGSYVLLDESSVTGTGNLIMAAALAEGKTIIYNAACEPHIQQLCHMLVNMGAMIEGIGSNLLTIHGTTSLKGTTHHVLPDMLEIGSIIGLAAMTGSEITLKNALHPQQSLTPILSRFTKLGIHLETTDKDLIIKKQSHYEIQQEVQKQHIWTISDAIWPGLPSDLLSIFLVAAIQAKGSLLIHQKMYESRLFFVDNLIEMGAKLVLCDPHRVHVVGLNKAYRLRGISMASPDIRAGIALLIAALSAEGTSVIDHVRQIDRGYERIEERLRKLGADIVRMS